MGLFDKLKSAANAITGGAATVTLEVGPVTRGEPTEVQVAAMAKSNVKMNGVYLLVRCTEKADFMETEFEDGEGEHEEERGQERVFETKIDVAGPDELQEGEEYSWSAQLNLPSDVNPTFRGKIIENTWEIQAGIDAFGNDPDSGWREIEVH